MFVTYLYMDKAYILSSPIMVRSLDVKNDPFRSCEKEEKLLGPEVSNLSTIVIKHIPCL